MNTGKKHVKTGRKYLNTGKKHVKTGTKHVNTGQKYVVKCKENANQKSDLSMTFPLGEKRTQTGEKTFIGPQRNARNPIKIKNILKVAFLVLVKGTIGSRNLAFQQILHYIKCIF